MAEEVRIVKTTFSSDGIIELPKPGEDEPQFLNLFQMNKSAWRFEADDGRYALVPIDNKALEGMSFAEAEAEARRQAVNFLQAGA